MIRTSLVGKGILATLTCISCARVAEAQITPSGEGYLFRAKYKQGQEFHFTMTSSGNFPGRGSIVVSTPFTLRVVDAKDNKATLHYSLGMMKRNGKPVGQLPGISGMEMTVDARNQTVSAAKSGVDNLAGIVLPEKPLHVGQTYAPPNKPGQFGSTPNPTATYKFLGVKTVNGHKVAEFTITHSSNAYVSHGKGTMLLAVEDGLVYRMTLTQTISYQEKGKAQKTENHLTFERQ